MHDYYLVTLSESLIFLGFSRLSAFDLMGVIWREITAQKNGVIITELNSLNPCKIRHSEVITMGVIWREEKILRNGVVENVVFSMV